MTSKFLESFDSKRNPFKKIEVDFVRHLCLTVPPNLIQAIIKISREVFGYNQLFFEKNKSFNPFGTETLDLIIFYGKRVQNNC